MVQWVWQNGSRVYMGLVLFLGVRLSMESKSGFYEDSFFFASYSSFCSWSVSFLNEGKNSYTPYFVQMAFDGQSSGTAVR